MKRNKLEKNRWLCIQAEFKKKAGDLTGTYAVAYISDRQLEKLFFKLDEIVKEFLKEHAEEDIVMT